MVVILVAELYGDENAAEHHTEQTPRHMIQHSVAHHWWQSGPIGSCADRMRVVLVRK